MITYHDKDTYTTSDFVECGSCGRILRSDLGVQKCECGEEVDPNDGSNPDAFVDEIIKRWNKANV